MRENQKGVHYFDSNFERGEAWYRGHFQTASARRAGRLLAGEASPYYLFHPLAAERAAALMPTAKIIVLLRDPVERAFSHWSEQRRNGVEVLSFADALDAETARVADAEQQLLEHRLQHSFAHEQQSYAAQSCYAASLQRWIDRYGANRVLVRKSEDFYARTQQVFDDVTEFLGIDRHVLRDVAPWNAAPKTELDPRVRARLATYLLDDAIATRDLVGITWP